MTTELMPGVVTTPVAADPDPVTPTRAEVLDALEALGFPRDNCGRFINYMNEVAEHVRRTGKPFYPYNEFIASHYQILEAVLPHNESTTPGSAGDLLERHLLRPADGELGFTHARVRDGELVHCQINLALNIQRV